MFPGAAPAKGATMAAAFDESALPRHIRVERSGRMHGGPPLAAFICAVCGGEEEAPDQPETLRAVAGGFVRAHMDCTPVAVDDTEP